MAKSLHGKATVDGIDGTITYAAIVANGMLEPLSAQFTDQADIRPRLDQPGEVQGFKVSNKRKEVTVTCLATVSTGTAMADAVKAVIMPPIPGAVTLAAFDEASGAGINGDYVYEGGGSIAYAEDWVRITLPLKKYPTAAATLVAAVT